MRALFITSILVLAGAVLGSVLVWVPEDGSLLVWQASTGTLTVPEKGLSFLPRWSHRRQASSQESRLEVAIVSAASEGGTHTLRGEGDDFVTHVINLIARENIRIKGFRTELPTLEDVFLKLTGHGMRD